MATRTGSKPETTPASAGAAEPASDELVPQFFSTDSGVGLPVIDPAPAFVYAHHRRRWTVRDGKIVPELAKIPLVSGCNRVLRAADGRIRFADTAAKFQERHWKIIPLELAPNGRSYLRQVDTLQGSKVVKATISCWETAHAGEAHTELDEPALVAWLESLVAKGHIAPITKHRAAEMLAAARSQLARAEHRVSTGKAASSERVEALRKEVAALEQAAKGIRGAPVASAEAELDLDQK